MNFLPNEHTASVLSYDWVLVVSKRGTELYNPSTGVWTISKGIRTERSHHTASVLLNGNVLISGGHNGIYNNVDNVELFHPSTGVWSMTRHMIVS